MDVTAARGMRFGAAPEQPSQPTPAPSSEVAVRRAPSVLGVPNVEDGSATAAASLDQVASYVTLLTNAMQAGPDTYARTIKRGFLDSALNYAKYAYSMIDFDQNGNNDGFKGMIEGAIIESIISARQMGVPAVVEPNIIDELSMAAAAANNAARALEAMVRSGQDR